MEDYTKVKPTVQPTVQPTVKKPTDPKLTVPKLIYPNSLPKKLTVVWKRVASNWH